jgi:NAD(P)-dependent dehydrogenase (short-subunit alcohol dehydrogenase family)
MPLTGLSVLITGAKGGLGGYVTEAFLSAGARVTGVSRSIAERDFPHERFTACPAELTSLESAEALVEKVSASAGRIDVLVHLVGGYAGGRPLETSSSEELDRMVELNLRTAFWMIRAVLPRMRAQGGGRILAIGSKAGDEPAPQSALYAASKAALISLIRSAAAELAGSGVTANLVLPGTLDTPANRAASPAADPSKWTDPRQVAELLVFLAGPGAAQINGARIPVSAANET